MQRLNPNNYDKPASQNRNLSENALNPDPVSTSEARHSSPIDPGIALSKGFLETGAFLQQIISDGAGIYLLTGEPGIGKSTALRYSKLHAADNIIVIIHSFRRIDVDNLSDLLGHTLGVKLPHNLPPEARALRYFLKLGTIRSKGKRLILMLDDVEELHSSGAELLKALVNMKDKTGPLITVVMCGNTTLNAFLDKSYRWGIQRLIRENHEIQGFRESELPSLISALSNNNSELTVPVKPAALKTLANLSKGNPGSAQKLLEGGTQIANKHHYHAISPRIFRGVGNGEFKTLPQIATQFAGKSIAAMALLLLVPVTLFQQDLQQQRADRPPLEISDTSLATTPNATLAPVAESAQDDNQQPAVAAIADDIALERLSSLKAEEPVKQVEIMASSDTPAKQGDYRYSGFNQLITPAMFVPRTAANPVIASFNQIIPTDRENSLQLLKRSNLTIPASGQLR